MKSVNVSFRLPYFTHWGQSLLVCGSEPVLGSWNVKKGLLLSPVHQGDELIWSGSVAVPSGFGCEYSYYVVDDDKNVLRWELGKRRKLLLPERIQDGEVVLLWFSFFFLMLYEFLKGFFLFLLGVLCSYLIESKSLLRCLGSMNLYLFPVDISALGISE